jgi:hypothetical protein
MTNTQAAIIAAGMVLGGVAVSMAQQASPAAINGCVYLATPPTLTNGQSTVFTCSSTGQLRVTTS